MITVFTLINSFTCFFLRKLNNFVGFITPVVKKWLIQMISLLAARLMIDCTTAQIEVLRKSLGGQLQITYHQEKQGILLQIKLYPSNKLKKKGKLDYITQQYICIWAYICETS